MTTLRLPFVSLPHQTSPSLPAVMAGVLRLAGREGPRGAGKTAGDVLGLRRLARDLRDDLARLEEVTVLDDDVRADGEGVASGERAVRQLERLARLRVLEADARTEIRSARLDDDLAREAGD